MTSPAASRQATLTIATGSSWAAAVDEALKIAPGTAPVLLLPASLTRTDALAGAVRSRLRASEVASHLLLPSHPAATLLRRSRTSAGGHWIDVAVTAPDVPPASLTLPARFRGPESIWSVTDVDAVRGSGPWVLDLVARYLHPVTRLRHLASRRRSDAVVDVNLVASPTRCIVGKVLDTAGNGYVVGVVDDPIAAELFALALADEDLPAAHAVTGPWEDRVVQRATELDLGIQIPQQLSIDLITRPDEAVRTAIRRVMSRIGVRIA